jgi:hypothetical protein
MDDRILSDLFHEALELEPRPGAYDRMRFAFTNRPVALKRRPAFRIKGSRMGLRVAAALAAVLIAIALVAAFLAGHHSPVGTVPAGQDANTKAYVSLVKTDYGAMVQASSNHCGTIQDTGCADAAVPVVAALQNWVGDLNAFNKTPAQLAVLDGQLRRHLSAAAMELTAAVAFQKVNNPNGFDLAIKALLYERAWIDPTSFAIEGSYPRVAASYLDAVRLARQALDGCTQGQPAAGDLPCKHLSQGECTSADAQACESDVQGAASQMQNFLIALAQNPAPSSLAAADSKFQADLVQADTALLAITDALLKGNSAGVSSAADNYVAAIASADAAAGALPTS